MSSAESKIISATILALLSIIVLMGVKIENLEREPNESNSIEPVENLRSLPDSIPTWDGNCVEGMW
jgi:hypothetical protein